MSPTLVNNTSPPAQATLRAADLKMDSNGALYVITHEGYADGRTFDSFLWKVRDPTLPAVTLSAATIGSPSVPTGWGVVSMGGTSNVPVIAGGSGFINIATVGGSSKIYGSSVYVGTGTSVTTSVKASILAFTDTMNTAAPALTNPQDHAVVQVNPATGYGYEVAYTWSRPVGATGYALQIAQDSAFNTVLGTWQVNSSSDPASSIIGSANGPNYVPGTTYYVRVRANAVTLNGVSYPWFSPYSSVISFTVAQLQQAPPQHSVTLGWTGSGTVTFSYTSSTTVQMTAAPSAGWQFKNWSGDAAGTANPLSLTVNAN
jgi:hypothetical protein